jgi:ankyrin repeat protein
MKNFYDKHPEHVVRPLMIDELTPLYIAGYSSEGTELLQHLLSLLPPSEIPLVISKKSDHHNNVFHEVASTNNVASAKLLISKLSQNNLPKLKMILENRNQIDETPLFSAAALGQTKMVKFLAKILVGNIRSGEFLKFP